MVFDEKWNSMIEEAGGMIEVFDYAINPTEYYEAGAYVSLTALETCKSLVRNKKEELKIRKFFKIRKENRWELQIIAWPRQC